MCREKGPDSRYYENPYPANDIEREEWGTLPLSTVEAHSILVNYCDRLSKTQKAALNSIIEGDWHSDQKVDFFGILHSFEDDEN